MIALSHFLIAWLRSNRHDLLTVECAESLDAIGLGDVHPLHGRIKSRHVEHEALAVHGTETFEIFHGHLTGNSLPRPAPLARKKLGGQPGLR